MTPTLLVRVGVAAFGIVFAAAAVLRHRAFASGRFDLGNMAQAVWSTAQGDVLSVTDVHGEQISRLGAHFDPILAALAPLWWLWPSPELLLVVQAFALAVGALPVHWLARKHLGDGFHAAALAFVPRLRARAMARAQRLPPRCPRDAAPAVRLVAPRRGAALGLRAPGRCGDGDEGARRPRGRSDGRLVRGPAPAEREGLAIAVVAGAVALAAVSLVVPHFAVEGSSAFAGRYDSPSLDGRDLRYLSELLFPLLFLPLAAPLAALAAVPELGLNLASSTVTQTSIKSHYAAVAVPALLAATVFGTARLGSRLAYPALAASAAGMLVLGPLGRVELRADAHDAAARRALELVPAGAPVSATNGLGAHLSARKRIFSFPVLREATWVVVDERHLTFLDSLKPGRARPALRALRRDPRWRLVFAEDGVLVFRRVPG